MKKLNKLLIPLGATLSAITALAPLSSCSLNSNTNKKEEKQQEKTKDKAKIIKLNTKITPDKIDLNSSEVPFTCKNDSEEEVNISFKQVDSIIGAKPLARVGAGSLWTPWYSLDTVIYITQGKIPAHASIQFAGDCGNAEKATAFGWNIVMENGSMKIGGNIKSLLSKGNPEETDECFDEMSEANTFKNLFKDSTAIKSVSSNFLPYKTMTANCYESMFEGCTSLTSAPSLPSKNLTTACYQSMFKGCTSLKTAPNLPAINLYNGCYNSIFSGCSLLQSVSIDYVGNLYDAFGFNNWVDTNCSAKLYYNGNSTPTQTSLTKISNSGIAATLKSIKLTAADSSKCMINEAETIKVYPAQTPKEIITSLSSIDVIKGIGAVYKKATVGEDNEIVIDFKDDTKFPSGSDITVKLEYGEAKITDKDWSEISTACNTFESISSPTVDNAKTLITSLGVAVDDSKVVEGDVKATLEKHLVGLEGEVTVNDQVHKIRISGCMHDTIAHDLTNVIFNTESQDEYITNHCDGVELAQISTGFPSTSGGTITLTKSDGSNLPGHFSDYVFDCENCTVSDGNWATTPGTIKISWTTEGKRKIKIYNKKAALTFEFANLISDKNGNSICTFWNNTATAEGSNYNYTTSSIRTMLNATSTFGTEASDATGWYTCSANCNTLSKTKESSSTATSTTSGSLGDNYNKSVWLMLPEGLRNSIKDTKHYVATSNTAQGTSGGWNSGNYNTDTEYTDKLFLPAYKEINPSGTSSYAKETKTVGYAYYQNHDENQYRLKHQVNGSAAHDISSKNVITDALAGSGKYNFAGYNCLNSSYTVTDKYGGIAWLSSPDSYYSNHAWRVNYTGHVYSSFVYDHAYGVAPAFCI